MNKISDQLSISDAPSVRKLDDNHNYDLVVTLGYFDQLGYERPAASDTGDKYVFPDGNHNYNDFKAAADKVVAALNNNERVLVHCQAGVSRSAGVCLAALSVYKNLSAENAFQQIVDARPNVSPEPQISNSAHKYIRNHKQN